MNPREDLDQGRLARTVHTEQGVRLTGIEGDGGVLKSMNCPEVLRRAGQDEQRLWHGVLSQVLLHRPRSDSRIDIGSFAHAPSFVR